MQKEGYNYSDLQSNIDTLIGKYGLTRTVKILLCYTEKSKIKITTPNHVKNLKLYIISQCIIIFDLKSSEFLKSQKKEYREARMICYHIIKKYTKNSFDIIAEDFKQTKRCITYNYQKLEEILTVPKSYAAIVTKYTTLEATVLSYISSLE